MDWFRWWHGSANDPKLRMIASECSMPLACVVGVWAYILECASNNHVRGQIDNFDYEVVSFHLGIDVETPCNAMKRRNMLHETDETLIVVNWDKWQPKRERDDNSSDRVRKHRESKKQSLTKCNANETPCNANETNVTPREDKRREEVNNIKPNGFDEFWISYPKKVGKGAAEKAWAKLKPDLQQVLSAVLRQKNTDQWRKDGGQFIPHPSTWLNEKRWLDHVEVNDDIFAGAL